MRKVCAFCKKKRFLVKRRYVEVPTLGKALSKNEICRRCAKVVNLLTAK